MVVRPGACIKPVIGAVVMLLAPLPAQSLESQGNSLTPEQIIQEGLRRQEERSRDLQRAAQPKADELKAEADRTAPGVIEPEAQCFVIKDFQLEGQDAAQFSWLSKEASPYLNHCIGVKGLSAMAADLDQRLQNRGFATSRVSLPPQNLQSGRLRVKVHSGRVADIHMVQPGQPAASSSKPPASQPDDRWGTWRNAFAVSPDDLLNIRDLEQGVENMKRLPSQNVTTRLEPGPQSDTSIVYIERTTGSLRERTRGSLSLDNSGSPSLGRSQLAANLSFDNPGGLNDIISLSLNTNAEQPTESHHSQSLSVNYSVPWNYSLLTLSASASSFAQYVQGTTVRFLSSGNSNNAEARLQHTAMRTASSKLGLYAAVSTRRAWSYLDDTEIIVQRRSTTNLETGITYKSQLSNATFEFDLGYRRGMPWKSAQDDFDTAHDGGLTLRPKIWTFNARYASDFSLAKRGIQYNATLRGQYTRDTTLSIDQISIGGRSSVRGFDGDAVLLAENGVVLRNEFTTPMKLWTGLDDSSLMLALDCGRVWGPSDVWLSGNTLAGLALGLKGRMGATQIEALLATPLHAPSNFTRQNPSLYLSLTYVF
jgi:hemolysin activation/secretion protein